MNPPFYCKSFLQIKRKHAKESRKFITLAIISVTMLGVMVGVAIAHCENVRLIDATTPAMTHLLMGIAQHK